jgi:hypothetical protein
VRAAGCALSEAELAALVEARAKEKLSAELRLHWWKEIKALPRGKTGKVDLRAVFEENFGDFPQKQKQAPAN